ncbi:aminotransferase class IV [Paraliomyxa miuraensis]|uniref:aminotransferase class IV n=1 Tax=Paraliomyxa miuraensis TaxID=376150 RepID=UPI002259C025|nr:aminotransferase class IV [Paraliomyxa miuraensis]MCX4245734.1 aminotransferase class IV [Paraliomyxa miuraensis]
MSTKVLLSTHPEPLDPEHAKISVFDRGFLYGDSVYETMRTAGGQPLELVRHLARLRRSADGIGLRVPFSDEQLADAIARTHAATANAESYVRVVVSRGSGPVALDPRHSEEPLLVVLVQPLVLPTPAAYERGISAVIVGITKVGGTSLDPTIKSGNYLNNILALRQAIAAGGEDAIMCNPEGAVSEGATSNVFMVAGGRLETPHLRTGLLPGITRQLVCELAASLHAPVAETTIMPDHLRAADEVFLTSSVRGIMPVTLLDGVLVGDGAAGPLTRRLHDAYEAYVAAAAVSARS